MKTVPGCLSAQGEDQSKARAAWWYTSFGRNSGATEVMGDKLTWKKYLGLSHTAPKGGGVKNERHATLIRVPTFGRTASVDFWYH